MMRETVKSAEWRVEENQNAQPHETWVTWCATHLEPMSRATLLWVQWNYERMWLVRVFCSQIHRSWTRLRNHDSPWLPNQTTLSLTPWNRERWTRCESSATVYNSVRIQSRSTQATTLTMHRTRNHVDNVSILGSSQLLRYGTTLRDQKKTTWGLRINIDKHTHTLARTCKNSCADGSGDEKSWATTDPRTRWPKELGVLSTHMKNKQHSWIHEPFTLVALCHWISFQLLITFLIRLPCSVHTLRPSVAADCHQL